MRGHVDLISKVMDKFHPSRRPEVADRSKPGVVRPRSAPGGSRQELSMNRRKDSRSELKKQSRNQSETAGPTDNEFDELGKRLEIARQEARAAWKEIQVLRRETEDLYDDCDDLAAQASAMRQEKKRLEQNMEEANREADVLFRESASFSKQMSSTHRDARLSDSLALASAKKDMNQVHFARFARSSNTKFDISSDIAQQQQSLALLQEQLQALSGDYSPRTINLMSKAANRWDNDKNMHEMVINELTRQLAVKDGILDEVGRSSTNFSSLMARRTTAAREDKMRYAELSGNTGVLRQELQEKEDVGNIYRSEYGALSEQVQDLEARNSELKGLEEEMRTAERNMRNRLTKSQQALQSDEVAIVRHRKALGEEQAALERSQCEISNGELLAAQAEPLPDIVHNEEALVSAAEISATLAQKISSLEEQCQRLVSEEQDIHARSRSEASDALSSLASQIEGQWRSEIEERDKILAELLGVEVLE